MSYREILLVFLSKKNTIFILYKTRTSILKIGMLNELIKRNPPESTV